MAPPTTQAAAALAREHFGLDGAVTPLPSYIDHNFRLDGSAGSVVLKFANPVESLENLAFENAVMRHLAAALGDSPCPTARVGRNGDDVVLTEFGAMRAVTFLPGQPLAAMRPWSPAILRSLGGMLGRVDRALRGFEHPAMDRELRWDLRRAAWIHEHLDVVQDRELRELLAHFVLQFDAHVEPVLPALRRSVIHNDANDLNLLGADGRLTGLIDFGDCVHSCTIFDLVIAGAYAILDASDPIDELCTLVGAFHAELPIEELELGVVFPALCMRYCVSVVAAELGQQEQPDNDYIAVSQAGVRAALRRLRPVGMADVEDRLRRACSVAGRHGERPADAAILARRRRLGPSLTVSYREPLQIVRGEGQYLFDAAGRAFVDCVNNVCHVGHCHPDVVAAASRQMATLNTNTRYLHETIVEYAERLTALFPTPLDTCFFVCSGSEANELALRLARTHTGRRDVVVLDHAYHGNTGGLVDLSPYKHDGPGGAGRPDHVHVAALPDGYRGAYRYGEPDLATRYAASVAEQLAVAAARGGAAAFLAESISGCGGQVEFPAGYLAAAFAHARAAGALCIADEVQVGFGRVGSHMWAFETQAVAPDIVTLGKPIGNGHPLGAVVTTAEIAATFANGMEYFNTFGGNPVSCATGLAVLDVLEREGLMAHAHEVGEHLLVGLRALAARRPLLGDVRGRGFFLGVECVRDPELREPAAAELADLVERLKARGFLLSTDGPLHNVMKFKPPMPFSRRNADALLAALDAELSP